MDTYCIYLRKSRADLELEARGEMETLVRHERTLLELAERRGLAVGAVYREIVSGETIAMRPVMQQLLEEVEKGQWTGVLVMEVERLARGDTIDQGIVSQAFRLSGTQIVTPVKTYDPRDEFDEEYFEFGLFMSRREYKAINRRLQRGRLASVNEGKYVGSVPPYGYERIRIEHDKGYTLSAKEDEADIVRLIFRLFTEGRIDTGRMGPVTIARYLDSLCIPSRHGNGWSPSTIRSILENPVYIGKIRWDCRRTIKESRNGSVVKSRPRADPDTWLLTNGLHPPLVDTETWERAQKLLSRQTTPPVSGKRQMTNPLAGLIICADCGRTMIRRPYGDAPAGLICPCAACPNKSSRFDYVEEALLLSLDQWLGALALKWDEEVSETEELESDMLARQRKQAKRELLLANRQLENLYDLLEQGIYDKVTFSCRKETIIHRIGLLEQTAATPYTAVPGDTITVPSPLPETLTVSELYRRTSSVEAQHRLLSALLERVEYRKSASGGRWDPDAARGFELILYPKLPGK